MVSTATAPAKIILLGEHFCVHGSPALSMAVNLNAKVKVKDWNQKGLYILSKNFEVEGIYRNGKYFDLKGGLTGKKILNPVRLAVEEVLKYSKYSIEGLKVEVDSKIPVGVGFGSSGLHCPILRPVIAPFPSGPVPSLFGIFSPPQDLCKYLWLALTKPVLVCCVNRNVSVSQVFKLILRLLVLLLRHQPPPPKKEPCGRVD